MMGLAGHASSGDMLDGYGVKPRVYTGWDSISNSGLCGGPVILFYGLTAPGSVDNYKRQERD